MNAQATTIAASVPPAPPAQPLPIEHSATPIMPDHNEIRRTLNVLYAPGAVTELRVLNTPKGTYAGRYENFKDLVNDAVTIGSSETTPNVYLTLQQLKPAVASNETRPCTKTDRTIGDDDVERYRWLLLDADPDREPSKVSSSTAEKELAWAVIQQQRAFLKAHGIESILADSGNGYHLLIRIDLPVSEKPLVKGLINAFADKFETRKQRKPGESAFGVAIDRKVFNPARICKLYGTVARKGLNTAERPWRLSRLMDVPVGISTRPVSNAKLRALLATMGGKIETELPSTEPVQAPIVGRVTAEMIVTEAARLGIALRNAGPWKMGSDDGHKWQMDCVFNPEHKTPDAFIFLSNGNMLYHCSHNSCSENGTKAFISQTGGFDFALRDNRPILGGKPIDGTSTKVVTEAQEMSATTAAPEEYVPQKDVVSEYPTMGDDLISQYARLLVEGTALPYCHVRENLKIVLSFLMDDSIRYPGHENLFIRGWHFNLGEPETGKTTAWVFVKDRWMKALAEHGVYLVSLTSYGSAQFLVKGFEDHPRMLLYVTEGNKLVTANEHIPAIFSSLSDLYDQKSISTGSFKNKPARCDNAEGSCVICITPSDQRTALQSKGLIGGGVIPRWTQSYSDPIFVEGMWPERDEAALEAIQREMLKRLADFKAGLFRVGETEEAKSRYGSLHREMVGQELGRYGKRIMELYEKEALLQAVFADHGVLGERIGLIDKEVAEWTGKWARHQVHLRILYWPIDAGNNVERMECSMRNLLKRAYPKPVSENTLKHAANVYREGSGGLDVYVRARTALLRGSEMESAGANRKGHALYIYKSAV